jgi:alpha-glucan phosphorylases
MRTTGTRYSLEVQPKIPERLRRLKELANDLLYGWDRRVRNLFVRLDRDLWERCGHNPSVFLRRVSQQKLENALEDRTFVEDYNRVLSAYDTYHHEQVKSGIEKLLDPKHDLVAYFCAEFGFHESLPIYSGGLGILAGDHCKAASDLGLPFVAISMLYRQGYFTQTIDGRGSQVVHYTPTNFADLPITPAVDASGQELHVQIELPDRPMTLKVWKAKAGHISLYLLDSDLPINAESDRSITYQLYGGDINTRIQQEIVLGIGGVRALRALGPNPTVWHINEGHAAFQILERCRECVERGMDFAIALELVAGNTVFTLHTPVSAGHDIFDYNLMRRYFSGFVTELGIDMEDFLKLGSNPRDHGGFNQTALALRGSRFHNGVSRIHGSVASRMEAYIWPQIPHSENPIGYVTNGVHLPTFLAREWTVLFDMQFGREWRNELVNIDYWQRIDTIPDHSFWSLHQSLKAALLEEVRRRAVLQHRRNGCSEAQIERLTRYLSPHETEVLTLGFARRFATYKRATLLFSDPARLARLLNDRGRPVIVIYAGKAHPHDLPGQELIRTLHDYSRRPEFEGRVILLEGYDLALARKLVSGVDVWINTPQYPLEASGTSGQKAGINAVLNVSVLDGWWGEGYNGANGWAITPHGPDFDTAYRDREEGRELLDILEDHVIPLYYARDGHGYSQEWVKMSKESMKSLLPRFSSQRMVIDYVQHYYAPASREYRVLSHDDAAAAVELAGWKQKVARVWPKVRMRRIDEPRGEILAGETLPIRIAAQLDELGAHEVVIECLVGMEDESGQFVTHERFLLQPEGRNNHNETLFRLDLRPTLTGLQHYTLRIYPYHALLCHRFETGCMLWM